MGKFLQVRVTANTVSEADVAKEWSSLYDLVWGEGGDAVPSKGVLELAQAVFDGVRAGLIDSEKAAKLKDKAEKAEDLRFKIVDALNARDPKEADKLSYEIEDCLDSLEDIASNF